MAKIKFIREYTFYGRTAYDIIYNSGRLVMTDAEKLPKTARAFLEGKTPRQQYDKVFRRNEYIYQ